MKEREPETNLGFPLFLFPKGSGCEIFIIFVIGIHYQSMGDRQKISIRFFDDREVRAVWDEAGARWWFSVLDIVGVLNAQDDYAKTATTGNT